MPERTPRHASAFGSAYQRGSVWWIQYRVRGEQVREPGGFDGKGAATKTEAEEKLKQRIGQVHSRRFVGLDAERLTVDEMLDSYLSDLETREKKGRAKVRIQLRPVRRHFGSWRAVDIKRADLDAYVKAMRTTKSDTGQPFAPATINRGLQSLRAAYRLAVRDEILLHVPYVPTLRENNVRKGFVDAAEFEAIVKHLSEFDADVARFGYLSGWRVGEILPLAWRDVDLEEGFVYLWDSKSGDPRVLPVDEDLRAVLERRKALRTYPAKGGTTGVSEYVFHVRGFKQDRLRSWREAAKAAGMPALLFHDLRRTVVRDLTRAGVPQVIAMKRTGHKTDSMFRRYNIVSAEDQLDAAQRLREYRTRQPGTVKVVSLEHKMSTASQDGSN